MMMTLVVLAVPAQVHADAAEPGDYASRVVSVEPNTPSVHVSVEGGDSFLLLRVDRGTTVTVPGYADEPFLRFEAEGAVWENRSSYTSRVSRSRYTSEAPSDASESAPDWQQVAGDGSYAWHDHRIHWMAPNDPPGKQPGDIILRASIILQVDGAPVTVVVESRWMPSASSVPMWLGIAVGIGVGGALYGLRRRRFAVLALNDLSLLALVVGWWQYSSLPGETGPRPIWWVLPAVALAATTAAAAISVMSARSATVTRPVAPALALLAALNLALWGWSRRGTLSHAVLPTDAPWWLDRLVTAAALTGGTVCAAVALIALGAATIAPPPVTPAS
jgi:hypothetical protein